MNERIFGRSLDWSIFLLLISIFFNLLDSSNYAIMVWSLFFVRIPFFSSYWILLIMELWSGRFSSQGFLFLASHWILLIMPSWSGPFSSQGFLFFAFHWILLIMQSWSGPFPSQGFLFFFFLLDFSNYAMAGNLVPFS